MNETHTSERVFPKDFGSGSAGGTDFSDSLHCSTKVEPAPFFSFAFRGRYTPRLFLSRSFSMPPVVNAIKSALIIACFLPMGFASAQEVNTHMPIVRRLDALRLPPEDFTAHVTIRKTKSDASDSKESRFRQYLRRRKESDGRLVLDALLVCDEPGRDAGKMILFVDDDCWFYDPPARRATRMPSQQVASQALVANLMNWRFADDFDHKLDGHESYTVAGKVNDCTILDFTPKPQFKNRPARVRCWIDAVGRMWKAEFYTASMKVFRRVFFTRYGNVLGVERPVVLSVENHGILDEVILSDVGAGSSPREYFDPDQLPKIHPSAF